MIVPIAALVLVIRVHAFDKSEEFQNSNNQFLNDAKVDYRKYYGVNYHVRCPNFQKSYKCLEICRSIGFQIFRLDRECRCSCREMKTTKVLPYFQWKTNGTTRGMPTTERPKLWSIYGRLSTYGNSSEESTTSSQSTTKNVTKNTTKNTTANTTRNTTRNSTKNTTMDTTKNVTADNITTTTEMPKP